MSVAHHQRAIPDFLHCLLHVLVQILKQNDEASAISTEITNPVTRSSVSTIAPATTQIVQIDIYMEHDEKCHIELLIFIEKELGQKISPQDIW